MGLLGLWASLGIIYWRWLPVRLLFAAPGVLGLYLLFAPQRPIDETAVRTDYVAALRESEGRPYRAHGESAFGVDEAGLVRGCFGRVLREQGVRQGSSTLLRGALALWWHDGDATSLANMAQGKTTYLFDFEGTSLTGAEARLQPGDLAVAGEAVWAYLGQGKWIGADAGAGKVVIRPGEALTLPSPIRFRRWAKLAL